MDYYLIIENGEPYNKGDRIKLDSVKTTIGRSSSINQPEISFSSPYVSRTHATISTEGNDFYITDMDSTHGTEVNGVKLQPYKIQILRFGDQISLVRGIVLFTFHQDSDLENTIALPQLISIDNSSLCIDIDKKQVYIEGNLLNISGKPMDLLILLYENRNKAISYEDIKSLLWQERTSGEDSIPDVGKDEISSLVYRLRKSLGSPYDSCIVTVPRFGLMLNIN